MDLDPKIYIPVIAALVGAFVGGLIKEIGTVYQSYREDKRILKRTLYNQLELWFEIRRCDPGNYLPMAVQKLTEVVSRAGFPEEQVKMMMDLIRPQLEAVFNKVKLGEPGKLKDRYQTVVDDLSRIDPLLAYEIAGRTEFENFTTKMEAFFEEADKAAPQSDAKENSTELKLHLLSQLRGKALHEIQLSMKKDIYRIAWRIGLRTRIGTWCALRRVENMMDKERTAELGKMIQESFSFAVEVQNKIEGKQD